MHSCGSIDDGYNCAVFKHEVGIAWLPKMAHNGATIRIGQESWCLPDAGFLFLVLSFQKRIALVQFTHVSNILEFTVENKKIIM